MIIYHSLLLGAYSAAGWRAPAGYLDGRHGHGLMVDGMHASGLEFRDISSR